MVWHPWLGSSHHYVVSCVFFTDRALSPIPWVYTHGWVTVTALRFYMVLYAPVGYHPRLGSSHHYVVSCGVFGDRGLHPFRGFTPIPWVITHGWVPVTTTWFHAVFLVTVGYHPRLGSFHRYAIRNGCISIIMNYELWIMHWKKPTAGFKSPPWVLNGCISIIMNYA